MLVKDRSDHRLELGRIRDIGGDSCWDRSARYHGLNARLGIEKKATLRLDASAALGILQRKGVGKIRHLDVGCLWLQEKEAREILKLAKEPGETNPADIGTKHLTQEV